MKQAVPALALIIEEMRRGDNLLFFAVRDITGLSPADIVKEVGTKERNNVTDLYLEWWDTKGKQVYLPPSPP